MSDPLLRVNLIGPMRVVTRAGRDALPRGRKSRALLARLCLAQGEPVFRSTLAALLWDRTPEQQSRSSLRQAIRELTNALGDTGPELVLADRETVRLNIGLCWIDTSAVVTKDKQMSLTDATTALEACGGQLLEGLDGLGSTCDQWLQTERSHYAEAVRRQCDAALAGSEGMPPAERLAIAQHVVMLDPVHEQASRVVIRTYSEVGDNAKALREYERLSEALRTALDLAPSRETKALYDAVRAHTVVVAGPVPETTAQRADKSARPRIAVLPLTNMSGDPGQRYFSDGITEDIITELSRFRTIEVIARNSSFSYRDKAVDVRQIGDELDVQFVVEGSVRNLSDRLRITVQLVNARTQGHIWAEKYDIDADEIFAVQDDVTRRVVGTLVPRIETEELSLARKRPTTDARAYDCYLRGKALYYAATDAATRAEAKLQFEQAASIDSQFAGAYCYLSAIHNNLATYSAGDPALIAARELGWAFASKAVALDDTDPFSHLSLAWGHMWRREFDAARTHIDIAGRLNPNDVDRAMDRGTTLVYLGEPEAALEVMSGAMRLNPFHGDSYLLDLAEALFVARRHDEMLRTAGRIADPSPKFTAWKAAALAHAGHSSEAARQAEVFVEKMRAIWIRDPPAGSAPYVDWMLQTCPFRRQEDVDHLLQGLRMAGLDVTDAIRRAPALSGVSPSANN